MSNDFFRQYLDLLVELEQNNELVKETDHTDEIEFSDSDSFDEVIEKIQKDERNRLGTGANRQAFHHPFDKRLVIKVAACREDKKARTHEECAMRNAWEYLVWYITNANDMPEKEHLMPCVDIHPDGEWLTMFKGARVHKDKKVDIKGKMLWVGDRSKDNYRVLDDKTYAVDYGTTKAAEYLNIPTEVEPVMRMLKKVLKKQGKPVNDPDYGKSTPHPDPLVDKQ